ncbi:hypothetical protein MLD38_024336 [Melastoma candidum]|uniref:Uncharacterized protein n=1 Tax=Melastoma candidum TaxID=119954 RepID=A0ACB9NS04_9MYRT|nr:hypothetical protein MLD38_024336 [Melastoma candidum]
MPYNGNDVVGEFSSSVTHKHPLRRFNIKEKIYDEHCDGCRGKATGELYGCIGCRFYLHKRCFELLLREIHHPLHPDHPLKPVDMNHSSECGYCHSSRSLGYSCDECGFFTDLRSADMTLWFENYMKEVTEESTPIRYPMHNHELAKFSVESWCNDPEFPE